MFESQTEIVLTGIVLIAGGCLSLAVGKWLRLNAVTVLLLYLWHTALSFYFSNYVLQNGGDAFTYYQKARFDAAEPGIGTDFVTWITSLPVILGLSYWPISLLFNVVGSIGLLFFYSALNGTSKPASKSFLSTLLIFLCAFLPSLSFWTSGIGKDAIAFLSVGLFLWSTVNFESRQLSMIAAILIMLLVRPHMAVIMVLSVGVGVLFVKELRGAVRFRGIALAAAAAVFAVPFALLYSGAGRFQTIGQFITERQSQNLGGGSSIDIYGMNPALRLLSFLYRPLPNEVSGIEQFAGSIENLILIALTLGGIVAIRRAGAVGLFRRYAISSIYALVALGVLSQVTANLGLAARQKCMIVPALLLIFIAALRAPSRKSVTGPPLQPGVTALPHRAQ